VAAAKADLKRFKPRQIEEEKAERIEPTAIDHFIIYLCHLALNSEETAEYLSEQLETLQECLTETLGNHVLVDILAKRPNPESEAAKQAYLMTIPNGDRIALENGFSDAIPEDPVSSACDTIAMLYARFYQIKEKSLRTRLNDPSLTPEEILEAFEEVKRLQSILKALDQRF
jgi:DNA primase